MIFAFLSGFLYEILALAWTRNAVAGRPVRTAAISFVTGLVSVAGLGAALRGGWLAAGALSAGYACSAYCCLQWGRRWL